MEVLAPSKVTKIRELNDNARRTFTGCVVTITSGIQALCQEVRTEVMKRVRTANHFSAENDPHGEHDFGAFTIGRQKFFWKFDYYDKAMEFGSEDPADKSKTTRVLCVMLAEEY